MTEQVPIRRLLAHTKNHRSTMWLATLFSILNKIFDLAPPLLIGAAVDVVVKQEESALSDFGYSDPKEQLIVLSILTVIIWVFESLFEYIYGVLWRNLAQTVQHELRLDAYSHIQNLEMEWFGDQSKGELMSILNDDINQLERFLDKGANELLQVSTTVVVISAIFFYISPEIAIYSILPIPIILWGSFRFQSRIGPRYAEVRKEVGLLNALLSNNLSGISTIKSFTSEEMEIARVREASQAYREANKRAIRLSAAFVPLIRMAILVGFTATLLHGGFVTLDGGMAIASYSVMIFMMQRLLWPLTRLGETFDLYQRAMVSTTRVLNLLETPIAIDEGDTEVNISEVKGSVVFEDVNFAYPDRSEIINGLNIEIKSGTTQAIVLRKLRNSSLVNSSKLLLENLPSVISSDKTTEPDVGSTNLSKVRIKVVLPQPLSPTIPNVLPFSISKLTPSRALTSAISVPQTFLTGKCFLKSLIDIILLLIF